MCVCVREKARERERERESQKKTGGSSKWGGPYLRMSCLRRAAFKRGYRHVSWVVKGVVKGTGRVMVTVRASFLNDLIHVSWIRLGLGSTVNVRNSVRFELGQ